MKTTISSKINSLINSKNPVEDTLKTIVEQLCGQKSVVLSRIWLIDSGDICQDCLMRKDCFDQKLCLHLTASKGKNLLEEIKWTDLKGQFRRIPLGVRKVGFVGKTGESVLINSFDIQSSPWILDKEWIAEEKIVSFAAQPLVFKDNILGVLAIFTRSDISQESFEWLKSYSDQASLAIANAQAFEELEKLHEQLEVENNYLKEVVNETSNPEFLVGKSPLWQKILQQIEMVANSDATVLITGESGTGKELIARAIHELSLRKNKPLVRVNCAAISPDLFESEFFGHVKGAFTNAIKDRLGRFQMADGGTIFLDEIGELPVSLQGKLLRVLQEKQFEKVGDDRTQSVNVRVIAATNHNLEQEVKDGIFRQDLFYRLTVFPIHLPPLRERLEDIEPLAQHFLKQFLAKSPYKTMKLTKNDISILQKYHYPGNIRELQNLIERTVIMNNSNQHNISISTIFNNIAVQKNIRSSENEIKQGIRNYEELKSLEKNNILQALKTTNYRIYGSKGAAQLLKIKPTTLISKIKAMNIPMRP